MEESLLKRSVHQKPPEARERQHEGHYKGSGNKGQLQRLRVRQWVQCSFVRSCTSVRNTVLGGICLQDFVVILNYIG